MFLLNLTRLRWLLAFGLIVAFTGRFAWADEPNQLSTTEQASGWRLLFDGKTTSGWRSFKKTTFPAKGWVVEDGWLKCVAGARGGDIVTVTQFTNFELRWEWRLPPKANNGLKYFITEARSQAVGHEYQMIDDAITDGPKHRTGAFYDVLPPGPHAPVHLAPESNLSRILVRGQHVEHWLNGEQILTYECGSEAVQAAVAKSKFRNVAGFGHNLAGHILLTEHRDEAWFRNIKIRELPAD